MMPEEATKPEKLKVPRTVDDFIIVNEAGQAYQGLNMKGKPQFGHPTAAELFRHKHTAETLAVQSRINLGGKLSVIPTSQIRVPRY